jgi:large subunit ribosomal protein L1
MGDVAAAPGEREEGMVKLAKRLKSANESFDREKVHDAVEALLIVKNNAKAKFDETVEAAFKLGIDPRKSDQMVRGTVSLPAGTGKDMRVAVFAEGEAARQAQAAGADFVGSDDLVEKVQAGWFDFDAAVATPDMMPKVGKIGKLLGPRGLMPNPKAGTVTPEVGKAVGEIKGGKVEFRSDKFGNVHLILGKASFEPRALKENFAAALDELVKSKPATAKGRYIKAITLSSTMGPGVRVDPNVTPKEVAEAASG